MIVTTITPSDKRKGRVCVDHFYTFPLYLSEIRRFHLAEGVELSDTTFGEIRKLLTNRLKERILYYITDCDRSERDIRRKMVTAGYPEDILDEVIERLKEVHYIDDERYARAYMESLSEGKGKPRNYIVNKLYERGIRKEIIEAVMEDYTGDERTLIVKELRKKGYDPEELKELSAKEQQKIYASLLRKGYPSVEIGRLFSHFE